MLYSYSFNLEGIHRLDFLVFQSAKVHFGVHLKMEKSLPNPILSLAPSYNIRNMACAGRAGKKRDKRHKH